MHILHCNTYDNGGGAAIAARRLHTALMGQRVSSRFGVLRTTTDTPYIFSLVGRWRRTMQPLVLRLDQFPLRLCPQNKPTTLFSPGLSPSGIHHIINKQQADILHLHWVAHGFIPTFSLGRLCRPVVWTLHDTWAFTGGCHILKGCKEYQHGCRSCPQLGTASRCNPARLSFNQKMRTYKHLRPQIIVPSRYMAEKVRKSRLLGSYPCRTIPNPVDIHTFKPAEITEVRRILELPPDAYIILFGAISPAADHNKGLDLLKQTLRILSHTFPNPVHLLVFGSSQPSEMGHCYPVHCLGHLYDDISLRLAYTAADIFVCPSREEAFSNTTLESLACGTPVAGFHVGGIPDMVEHEVSGWLSPCYDTEHLARGIAYMLESTQRRRRMGEAARAKVVREYAADVVARRYISVYENILASIHLPR